jgi:hypothetical protein
MTARPHDDIRGACPLDCPDTCSWIVTVKQGEAIALRGDPEHPTLEDRSATRLQIT